MFGTNVMPKNFGSKELSKEAWYCHKCNQDNKHYLSKCPQCGTHRPH